MTTPGAPASLPPRPGPTERAAEWVYRGIWAVLTGLFRVPDRPPTLPAHPGDTVHAFKPAPEFLRYLKFLFWFWLAVIDAALLIAWIVIASDSPTAGAITAPLFLALIVVPDVLAYIAIHLRYDTTWYLISPRSLRIRRGIWVIHETTITFENIQNVEIHQGPLQRWYGVSNLIVKTAGGGGGGPHPNAQHGRTTAHVGLIEGITDAPAIRSLILEHVARSRTAGLGDERDPAPHTPAPPTGFTPDHILVLRQIRDTLAARAGLPLPRP